MLCLRQKHKTIYLQLAVISLLTVKQIQLQNPQSSLKYRDCSLAGLLETKTQKADQSIFKFRCGSVNKISFLKLEVLQLPWSLYEARRVAVEPKKSLLSFFLLRRRGSRDIFLAIKPNLNGERASFRRFLVRAGFETHDSVNINTPFQGIVAIWAESTICKCFTLRNAGIASLRERRSTTETEECTGFSHRSVVLIDFNVAYTSITPESLSTLATKTAAYAGIQSSGVSINEHVGFIFAFYPAKLVNFGMGDNELTIENSTFVRYVISCGQISSSDSRVTKLRNDATSGSLSQSLGQPVRRWFVLTKENTVKTTTTQTPR